MNPRPEVTLDDDALLNGLWWGDPEYHPLADVIWREYVEAKHAWEERKKSYATLLRWFSDRADTHPWNAEPATMTGMPDEAWKAEL